MAVLRRVNGLPGPITETAHSTNVRRRSMQWRKCQSSRVIPQLLRLFRLLEDFISSSLIELRQLGIQGDLAHLSEGTPKSFPIGPVHRGIVGRYMR